MLGIRSTDPRFTGGNTGDDRSLYLDGDLLQKYNKDTHVRTEQEVYIWMTTSEMGFPVTQERRSVWWDIVEDRPVARFLSWWIGSGAKMIGSQQATVVVRYGKHCLTGVSFTPHETDLDMSSLHTRLILTCLNITRVRNHTRGTGNKRLSQDGRTVRIHSQTRM